MKYFSRVRIKSELKGREMEREKLLKDCPGENLLNLRKMQRMGLDVNREIACNLLVTRNKLPYA